VPASHLIEKELGADPGLAMPARCPPIRTIVLIFPPSRLSHRWLGSAPTMLRRTELRPLIRARPYRRSKRATSPAWPPRSALPASKVLQCSVREADKPLFKPGGAQRVRQLAWLFVILGAAWIIAMMLIHSSMAFIGAVYFAMGCMAAVYAELGERLERSERELQLLRARLEALEQQR
jgi:hypothetical protein